MLNVSPAQLLASLPEAQRNELLAQLSPQDRAFLNYHWPFWARPEQLQPAGDWSTWLNLAGRGFGKTRTGSETVRDWICGSTPLAKGRYRRLALVAETAADARDVLVEGDSGILACHPKAFRPRYEPSKRRLTWPNGARATLYNATEPDQLRGPQHDGAWCDELAKWAHAQETWDQLQFGLRLGLNPRAIVTTTPRPLPIIRELIADPTTVVTRGRTMDNAVNLAKKFIDRIHKRYAGTRLGRQELEAEVLDDLPGAYWLRTYFDPPPESKLRGRINYKEMPELQRVVVAVDPSGIGKSEDGGDTIGIIVAGIDYYDHGYILADRSIRGGPPEWGRAVVNAYHEYKADRVVAETNFGGAMVENTIKSVDSSVSYKAVHASRGKVIRAEPVAALYEQGRVSHVTGGDIRDKDKLGLTELEDQLCLFSPAGYSGSGSPDRADAAVWALTELMIDSTYDGWVLTR